MGRIIQILGTMQGNDNLTDQMCIYFWTPHISGSFGILQILQNTSQSSEYFKVP